MSDLTRWNRAGLSELRYVDGNAATYLDAIRTRLDAVFGGRWRDRLRSPYGDLSDTDDPYWLEHRRNEKLVGQYLERGDLLWEMLRTFARSCHVLTEHIDAEANESFLRTATEWDDVRRLVAMLDYHPAAATSATTHLAIEARSPGTLEAGVQVRHRKASGESIVFETLDDLDIDPAFNELRVVVLEDLGRTLDDLEDAGALPLPLPTKARVRAGESALLLAGDEVAAAAVSDVGELLRLEPTGAAWEDFLAVETQFRASPRFRRAPWINGPAVRRSAEPHGLSRGSVIAWRPSTQDLDWCFALVKRADAFGLELELPGVATEFPDEFTWRVAGAEHPEPDAPTTDQWPAWHSNSGPDHLELEPAIRLAGTVVVPAETGAELAFPEPTPYTVSGLVERPDATGTDAVSLEGWNDPTIGFELMSAGGELDSLKGFIEWLFGGAIKVQFPITPDVLVDIGAMIKTKDARIPSTGQLVYEAFLDLFGGSGAGDETTVGADEKPALFRYWRSPDDQEADGDGNGDGDGQPGLLGPYGELWYFPVKDMPRGGLPDRRIMLFNEPDGGWFFFDGRPTGLSVDDWAAARFSGQDEWVPVKIADIQTELAGVVDSAKPYERHDRTSAFAVELELADGSHPTAELLELQGDFRADTTPLGGADDEVPIADLAVSGEVTLRPYDSTSALCCPTEREIGRQLVAVTSDGRHDQLVTIVGVDRDGDPCTTTLEPALPKAFTVGNTALLGNVVRAGHGERRPAVRLSSGTRADRPATLLLGQADVSTVPDSRLAHGARPDIEVVVDGEKWAHKLRLDDSDPADRHYATTTTEDGHLRLRFGDGVHGRRLPIGRDNVLVQYRSGAGRIGELPPWSLEHLVRPHPLVVAVRQPTATTPGSDIERPELMRSQAPPSLLALDRAVSADDYAHVAEQHSGVLRAIGRHRVDDRSPWDVVEVLVVPVGAQGLRREARRELAEYLQHRATPGIRVAVSEVTPVPIGVDVAIRVDTGVYEREAVRAAVVEAVAGHCSREVRPIGMDLHLAEVYEVVESVTGVENSVCSFRAITPADAIPDTVHPHVVTTPGRAHVVADPDSMVFVPDAAAVGCTVPEYVR